MSVLTRPENNIPPGQKYTHILKIILMRGRFFGFKVFWGKGFPAEGELKSVASLIC
jgi:hypothetical protein